MGREKANASFADIHAKQHFVEAVVYV